MIKHQSFRSPESSSSSSLSFTVDDNMQFVCDYLSLFHQTFDRYRRACVRSADNIAIIRQLGKLRRTIEPDLPRLTEMFVAAMSDDFNLVRLENDPDTDYVCFGDLHGSLTDLVYLRQLYWHHLTPDRASRQQRKTTEKLDSSSPKLHFVFLGDYVDRGIHGFEIAAYLILMRLAFPQHFTVLRGNHEIRSMNRNFFLSECRLKFGNAGFRVWRMFNQCFSMLPYAALINGNVFACHGGIPRTLNSVDDIELKIPKGLHDVQKNQLALQLLWNDFRCLETNRYFVDLNDYHVDRPLVDRTDVDDRLMFRSAEHAENENQLSLSLLCESDRKMWKYFVPNRERAIGYIVGHSAVRYFCRKHGIQYIVRAHQFDSMVAKFGYNEHTKPHVFTVFSNSSYVEGGNSTACAHISTRDRRLRIVALRRMNDRTFRSSEIFECNQLANMKFEN